MQDTDATTITSRRANSALVAEWRSRSISSLIEDPSRCTGPGPGRTPRAGSSRSTRRSTRPSSSGRTPELVIELGRERLVVRDHERRPLHLLDREGHRGRLARAGHAEERLEPVPLLDALSEPGHRGRLVRDGLVGGVQLELRHDLKRLRPAAEEIPSAWQDRRDDAASHRTATAARTRCTRDVNERRVHAGRTFARCA